MNKKVKQVSQGFTIIEVLIVLAIAALILAVVFFAVPQLQRSQRDNQRQSVDTRLKTELDSYAGNNQGSYPFNSVTGSWALCNTGKSGSAGTCQDWAYRYLTNDNINDPQTKTAVQIYIAKTTTLPTQSSNPKLQTPNVFIAVGAKCSGDQLQSSAGNANNTYAVVIALERSGTDFCVDNG